jgi:hypothetical protein
MLIGQSIAIVPIGISCQPTVQIEEQKSALEDMAGEELVRVRTPFDWRIVGLGNIAGMIETGEFFPAADDEIAVLSRADGSANGPQADPDDDETDLRARPYWRRQKCWFWHETLSDFADFAEKQAHLAANFARIEDARRRVFFASNLQSNLRGMYSKSGGFDIPIALDDVLRLARALNRRFGSSTLHVLTRSELTTGFDALAKAFPRTEITLDFMDKTVFVHCVSDDPTQRVERWKGDAAVWKKAFRGALGHA